jgi:hypothetical protein
MILRHKSGKHRQNPNRLSPLLLKKAYFSLPTPNETIAKTSNSKIYYNFFYLKYTHTMMIAPNKLNNIFKLANSEFISKNQLQIP